jgi:hypothetical protein
MRQRLEPRLTTFADATDLTPQAGHFKTGALRFVLLFWFLAALVGVPALQAIGKWLR